MTWSPIGRRRTLGGLMILVALASVPLAFYARHARQAREAARTEALIRALDVALNRRIEALIRVPAAASSRRIDPCFSPTIFYRVHDADDAERPR